MRQIIPFRCLGTGLINPRPAIDGVVGGGARRFADVFRIVDLMYFRLKSRSLTLVCCTNSYSERRAVGIISLKEPSVICPPISCVQTVPCGLHVVQEFIRVLTPLWFCAIQAVVKLLASRIAAGVVIFLQHLPSLLPVSDHPSLYCRHSALPP